MREARAAEVCGRSRGGGARASARASAPLSLLTIPERAASEHLSILYASPAALGFMALNGSDVCFVLLIKHCGDG